jgi:Fic family protein
MKASRSDRAGRTHEHPDGYRLFEPAALPPPDLDPGAYETELDQAARALGALDAIGELLPNPEILLVMSIRREALLSAQIEGTQASLDDVLGREVGLPSSRSDVDDVLNYINALNGGIEALGEYTGTERSFRALAATGCTRAATGRRRTGSLAPGPRRRTRSSRRCMSLRRRTWSGR